MPTAPTSPGHQLAFICGLHRSGTSLLHRCLSEHPSVSGFRDTGAPEDEGQHLQSVYLPASAYGGPGHFAFHQDAHRTEASPLATPDNRARLWADWSPYWDLAKPVIVEKSPPNLIQTRFLQELFPTASFVVIVRHPVAVTLATRKWASATDAYLLQHWLVAHETFLEDARYLRKVAVVRYEDLVRDPAACLADVYRFLGLDPFPGRIAIQPGLNRQYFERWRHRRGLSAHLARTWVERVFERRVRAFGYSLQTLEDRGSSVLEHLDARTTAVVRIGGLGTPCRDRVA